MLGMCAVYDDTKIIHIYDVYIYDEYMCCLLYTSHIYDVYIYDEYMCVTHASFSRDALILLLKLSFQNKYSFFII